MLLDFIVKTLHEQVLDAGFVKRLRAELRSQVERGRNAKPTDQKRLQREVDDLDRKMKRGTENLLLADRENLADLQAMLAEWRERRRELAAELSAVTPPDKQIGVEATVTEALAELGRLREDLVDDDPALRRAAIHQMVERVELWFEVGPGKRGCSRLSKGLLIIRQPLSNSAVYDGASPSCPPQTARCSPRH